MRPTVVSNTATGISDPVVLDIYQHPFEVTTALSGTGSNINAVQVSYDDPWAVYASSYSNNATWVTLSSISSVGATGSAIVITTPTRAVRLSTPYFVSGSASMTVIQSGVKG